MISELRRRKMLSSLRSPASEYDAESAGVTAPEGEPELADIEDAKVSIDSDEIDLEGILPDPVQTKSAEIAQVRPSTVEPRESTGLADVLTGAAPALLGLLSGNTRRTEMGFNKGNTYLQNLYKADQISAKNLVKVRGDKGEPIFIPSMEAAGREAYVASKAGAGKSPKQGELRLYQRIDDPSVQVNMRINALGQPMIPGTEKPAVGYEPATPIQMVSTVDEMGRERIVPVAPRVQMRQGSDITTKLGTGEEIEYNGRKVVIPPKKVEQAQTIVKESGNDIQKYQEGYTEIEQAGNQLKDKYTRVQVAKLAMGKIMTAVEKRMSNEDRAEYKSELSVIDKIRNEIDQLNTNEMPEGLRMAFVKSSRDMANVFKHLANTRINAADRQFSAGKPEYSKYIRSMLTGIQGGVPYSPAEKRKIKTGSGEMKSGGGVVAPPDDVLRRKEQLEEALKNK